MLHFYMETMKNNGAVGMELIKVAMIRQPGYPSGQPAPLFLKCPCGAKPATDVDKHEDVVCSCGQHYTYNGWLIDTEKNNLLK